MIFGSIDEVSQFLRERPMLKEIEDAQAVSKSLTRYVTGKGLAETIGYLSYFEKMQITDIKRKLVKSTRDMVERLLQPMDRVFTAKGGARVYYLPEKQSEQLEQYLSNVRKGMSMQAWVKNIAFKAYLTDPMGLAFTELGADGKPYPTQKSIHSIYCYLLNGRRPEAVAFELSDEEKNALYVNGIISENDTRVNLYRVVDDIQDMIVRIVGNDAELIYGFEHGFEKVPGIVNSDIISYDGVTYESVLMPGIELIAEYFDSDADKALYKKSVLHPREWSVVLECTKCEGTKVHKGEDCDNCNGTGILPHLKLADRINVAISEDGSAKVPTPPGGFYSADIEPYDRVKQDLTDIEILAEDTIYERRKIKQAQGPNGKESDITATGELMNEKTKEPKLKKISKWAASMDQFLTDNIKLQMFGSAEASTIIYGDKYLHGTVEQLVDEYHKLIAKGAPVTLLDSFLLDIIEAKFESNPAELVKHKKLMYVEPFVHHKINDVLGWNVPEDIKLKKLYFSNWLNTVNDMVIIDPKNTEQKLSDMLTEYITSNSLALPQPEKEKVAA